jgi:L-asparaginase
MKNSNHENKANVHLLSYGGTISSLLNDNSNEFYSTPSVDIQDMLSRVPNVNNIANVTCEQVLKILSHEMTQVELINVAKKVSTIINKPDCDGIVIAQGTNSIEEVAYFLNLVINTNKPVVLTGAMRPLDALGYDGLRNIYNSILVAGSAHAKNLGVILSFNDIVSTARDTTKQHTSSINALSSSKRSILGSIQGNSVDIRFIPAYKHTCRSDFSINEISTLPKIYMIYGHLYADEIFVDAAISNGAKGIISIGMGKGYQPELTTKALAKAVDNGCIVVRCSRTGLGSVTRDTKLDDKYGFIAGGSLSPQKARILLSVALAYTSDKSKIQKYFDEY